MESGNKSTLTKATPTKSTPAKSNARSTSNATTSATPRKRKQESSGGVTKKMKIEEESKKSQIDTIPSIVLAMGTGDTGQLGLGEDILERKRPSEIPNLTDIVAIRAGGMHSVCLSKLGKVYTFGCQDEGALGRPIVEDEEATIPGLVELPADVVVIDITAGDNHSSVLTNEGRVYIWGSFRDSNGTIGLLRPFEKLQTPTLLPIDRRVVKIASGENHFSMLTDNGDIYTLGCAEQGQLGRISPNNLVRGGRGGLGPLLSVGQVRVRHNVKFVDIWAGAYCTVGLSTDGSIYGCGLNNYHQLGLTSDSDDMVILMMMPLTGFNALHQSWRSFAFGQHHTVALGAVGSTVTVFVIGRGDYGSLGLGNNEHGAVVTKVDVPQSDNIVAIAACNRTSYALMADGSAFSWGMGSNYMLGHAGGDDDDANVPAKIVGKQITDKRIIEISPGFQHVLFRIVSNDQVVTVAKDQETVVKVQETVVKVQEIVANVAEVVSEDNVTVAKDQETVAKDAEVVPNDNETVTKEEIPTQTAEIPIANEENPSAEIPIVHIEENNVVAVEVPATNECDRVNDAKYQIDTIPEEVVEQNGEDKHMEVIPEEIQEPEVALEGEIKKPEAVVEEIEQTPLPVVEEEPMEVDDRQE